MDKADRALPATREADLVDRAAVALAEAEEVLAEGVASGLAALAEAASADVGEEAVAAGGVARAIPTRADGIEPTRA